MWSRMGALLPWRFRLSLSVDTVMVCIFVPMGGTVLVLVSLPPVISWTLSRLDLCTDCGVWLVDRNPAFLERDTAKKRINFLQLQNGVKNSPIFVFPCQTASSIYSWIKDWAFNQWGHFENWPQVPPPFVAISGCCDWPRLFLGVIIGTRSRSAVTLSKWCQDKQYPTDVVHAQLSRSVKGSRTHKRMSTWTWEIVVLLWVL